MFIYKKNLIWAAQSNSHRELNAEQWEIEKAQKGQCLYQPRPRWEKSMSKVETGEHPSEDHFLDVTKIKPFGRKKQLWNTNWAACAHQQSLQPSRGCKCDLVVIQARHWITLVTNRYTNTDELPFITAWCKRVWKWIVQQSSSCYHGAWHGVLCTLAYDALWRWLVPPSVLLAS